MIHIRPLTKKKKKKKKSTFNKMEILGAGTLPLESFCSACRSSKGSGIKLMDTGCWDFSYNELAQYCVHWQSLMSEVFFLFCSATNCYCIRLWKKISSHLHNFLLGFWERKEHISIHSQKQQASLTVVWQVRHVAMQEPASMEETAHVFVANIFTAWFVPIFSFMLL